ncbi:unnamed protein product [Rangifer tarandus platyrhynchus]|uniref:Uncharacterized protein n=1 Tax=Rangifer tarandus platyrhynchus TaxID=3082113 RepID=A0ABN8Y3V9_RANTA|nr:unnamed protein product [Rangifer tarandus platyrhynchus]
MHCRLVDHSLAGNVPAFLASLMPPPAFAPSCPGPRSAALCPYWLQPSSLPCPLPLLAASPQRVLGAGEGGGRARASRSPASRLGPRASGSIVDVSMLPSAGLWRRWQRPERKGAATLRLTERVHFC